jgi:hypothetical protein
MAIATFETVRRPEQKNPAEAGFTRGERRDLNPRPPGPQAGAGIGARAAKPQS